MAVAEEAQQADQQVEQVDPAVAVLIIAEPEVQVLQDRVMLEVLQMAVVDTLLEAAVAQELQDQLLNKDLTAVMD